MDDSSQLPVRLVDHVDRGDHERALDCVEWLAAAPTDDRKEALRRLYSGSRSKPTSSVVG